MKKFRSGSAVIPHLLAAEESGVWRLIEEYQTQEAVSITAPEQVALAAVQMLYREGEGLSQPLEFLAKTLFYGPAPLPDVAPARNMNVLLATPIYVAVSGPTKVG